jgi:hypothetical protein
MEHGRLLRVKESTILDTAALKHNKSFFLDTISPKNK